jgi:hypothetical protein
VILDKAGILGADDVRIEKVPAPEWGGAVCVRNLKGWERDQYDGFSAAGREKKDFTHFRAKLVSLSLCDESGKSLEFTEADMLALSNKSAAPLSRLYHTCLSLSGFTDEDAEALEKNDSGQSESSGEN